MNQSTIDIADIDEWISQDLSEKNVEATLVSKGYETGLVKEYLFEFKRLKRAKSQIFGLMILSLSTMAGIFVCFIAFHK